MLAVHDSGRYQCVAVAVWSATFAANVGAIFYGRWLLVKVGQASGLSADGFARLARGLPHRRHLDRRAALRSRLRVPVRFEMRSRRSQS